MQTKIRSKFANKVGELIFKGRLNGTNMWWWEKAWFVFNLVFAAIILFAIIQFFNQNSVHDCWNKYSSEFQAISHCENNE